MERERNYVVYQITNKINNNIYIGCHVTKNLKDNYLGSGTNIKKALKEFGQEHFEKIILYNFDNKEDMLAKERELVNEEFIKRQDTYNIVLGGAYNSAGTITVKDKDGNTMQVSIDDPRYLSGELVHVSNGKITVKDKNGNIMCLLINDPRYLSGELVGITKNTATVKDKDGNTMQVSIDDPRYLSGELVGIAKNTVLVKDKDGNTMRVSIKDSRYLSDELVHISKNTVKVKDKNGNIMQVLTSDPRYLSGELVFIWTGRKHSEKTKRKIGEKNSISQKGSSNSQYGKCWITNNIESKKICKGDLIPDGWRLGRVQKKK